MSEKAQSTPPIIFLNIDFDKSGVPISLPRFTDVHEKPVDVSEVCKHGFFVPHWVAPYLVQLLVHLSKHLIAVHKN